jgi:hypothetical protein
MATVEYGSKEVVLSRVYPFGETKNIADGLDDKKEPKTKEVTAVTVNELNGFDDETINKQIAKDNKLPVYVQISVSCGLEYDECKHLANKDGELILETIKGF